MSGQGRVPSFNFICGVFRSREPGLLTPARVEALVSARDFTDALAQLPDGPFALEARRAPGADGVEVGSRAVAADLKGLVLKYSPCPELNDLAFLPWDFHNLKTVLLQKLTGRKADNLAGPEGGTTVAEMERMAEAMRFDSLPKPLALSLERALVAYYESDKDAQAFELALDRQKLLRLMETGAAAPRAVQAYYAGVDDASTAESFVRLHRARVPWTAVRDAFAGHADAAALKELYALSTPEWGGRLATVSREPVRLLLQAAASSPDPGAVLLAQKKKALALMHDWRFRPPSFEYALYYVTRLLLDVAVMRLVLLCKLNGIDAAEIGKRVLDALV